MARFMGSALFVTIVTSSSLTVQAGNFLGFDAQARSQLVQQQFHNQLRILLGHGDVDSSVRLMELQAQIESLYSAMPKDSEGGLDQGAVRYALHRFFVQKHGWHVRGLETTGGDTWNSTTSTVAFEDHIPSFVLELFEQQHGGRTGLRELAVLAATMEDVVHSEVVELLSTAYEAQGKSVEEKLTGVEAHRVIETYLLFYLMPNPEFADLEVESLNFVVDQAPQFYTGWLDTVTWVQDVQDSIAYEEFSQRNPFVNKTVKSRRKHEFNSIVQLVERVGEKHGQFQNLECKELKNSLLDLSDGSGRVRLARFYKATFEGHSSHFSESPDYLRHLGALDDSDLQQPSVLITNYMYARANCMASSGLYSICCIDECEVLMAHLESNIAHPLADPELVVELVAAMPSETVAAPRNLSAPMQRRLKDIAQRHGGSVPLHGRLFAQWMHHAFPNECKYPHVTGSLEAPLTTSEWMEAEKETGRFLKASREEMQGFIEATEQPEHSNPSGENQGLPLLWSDEEELAVAIPVPAANSFGKLVRWLRLVALSGAIFSVVVRFSRMVGLARSTLSLFVGSKQKSEQHLVNWV